MGTSFEPKFVRMNVAIVLALFTFFEVATRNHHLAGSTSLKVSANRLNLMILSHTQRSEVGLLAISG
jgi:hypothetical protein